MGQIYHPAGSGASYLVHPEVSLKDLDNFVYCMLESMRIFLEAEGSPEVKASLYKGERGALQGTWFSYKNERDSFRAGGLTLDGHTPYASRPETWGQEGVEELVQPLIDQLEQLRPGYYSTRMAYLKTLAR